MLHANRRAATILGTTSWRASHNRTILIGNRGRPVWYYLSTTRTSQGCCACGKEPLFLRGDVIRH
jgi:hypothetical protein